MLSASIIEGINTYFSDLSFLGYIATIVDIFIVAALFYYFFLLIKGTSATRIIYGIIFIIAILVFGRLLHLQTLNWLLDHLMTLILVAIPIVFQPELRRGLEKLGRAKFFKTSSIFRPSLTRRITEEVAKTCSILVKNKIGALIVFQRKTGLFEFIETGEQIWSNIGVKIILNIFYPASPLHDGAMIIVDDKIAATSCILPLTENEKYYMYGTRHRAALGLSEQTDAVCVVISEERQEASIVSGGRIKQIKVSELAKKLEEELMRGE